MSEAQWTVVFAAEAINDLLLITEYLTQSYCGFWEPLAEANRHAQVRIEAIITAAERLATAPFRGESHDDLLPGLRHLTLDRAVYWFLPRDQQRQIQVLAVFFGGQDHQRRMLVRLLQNPPAANQ
jgi:toxin ParE1/3/4